MNTYNKQPRVLIIEDQRSIAETIELYLNQLNIDSMHCFDGETALKELKTQLFDLILLDIMLPGKSGLIICQELRRISSIPVIILTAKSTEDDIVMGLESGADDYVIKPFNPRELMARVKSHLRRSLMANNDVVNQMNQHHGQPDEKQFVEQHVEGNLICYYYITLYLDSRQVTVHDQAVKLTKSEFQLLKALIKRPGRVFTRNQLIEVAFGYDYEGSTRTLDTHMHNLRKKIEKNPHKSQFIHTEHGVGYRFDFIPC